MRWILTGFLILLVLKIMIGTIMLLDSGHEINIIQSRAIASDKFSQKNKKGLKEYKNLVKSIKNDITEEYLIKKQKELEKKEKELRIKEAELLEIQKDLTEKIAKLERLRDEIKRENEKKVLIKNKRLKHLIKVYTSMKPASAAKLIEKLDTKVAVELLSKMKGNIAGNILSYMSVDKAAKISEGLYENK